MDVARVLVVEDDEIISTNLGRALRAHGLEATVTSTLAEARTSLAADGYPDLVLLDLGLPDGDGVDLCGEVHAVNPLVPVVVLTARSDEIDIVVALRSGAVDYVMKPFRLAELLARIDSHLRTRALVDAIAEVEDTSDEEFAVGSVVVRPGAHQAFIGGVEMTLRPREFALLLRLIRDAGTVVPRESLIEDVWDEHWWGSTKTLDVHINALRRKLGAGRGHQGPIVTIRGVGYRYEAAS